MIQRFASLPRSYRYVLTVTLTVLVILLSTAPAEEQYNDNIFAWLAINTATALQNLLHVVLYALLTVAWTWSLGRTRPRVALPGLFLVVMGIAMELIQLHVPGRYASLSDILGNTAGVGVGILLVIYQSRSKSLGRLEQEKRSDTAG